MDSTMMADLLIVLSALALLILLLASEKQGRTPRGVVVKGCVSALFVATALVQPHPVPAYYHLILAGLVFGLIGDVCLAIPGNRSFRIGLFAFLVGHVFYVWAFAGLTALGDWVSPVQLIMVAFSVGAFWWLRPHVGRMMVPVVVYLVVITLMLVGAWAVFRLPGIETAGRGVVLIGALCFYLSDLFVARQRFVTEQYLNRLVGLPLYYIGQFLLAFSVGMVA
jgi:uncharacterized membrane protein YhhN